MPTTAPPVTNLTRPLATVGLADVGFAGAKGAVLGELVHARFPVPPGFVVSGHAYSAFALAGTLGSRVAHVLGRCDLDDDEALDQASGTVRGMIESEPLPDWLSAAVESAYATLGAELVAVRPSPVPTGAEDFSTARMYDSFLDVAGAGELLTALRRCWSSLYSPHAIRSCVRREGIRAEDAEFAVVVQAQVPATRAGVACTLDPTTGDEDRLIVDAAPGLGAGVVSGSVSSDRYVIDKGNLVVVSRALRAERRAIAQLDGVTAVHGMKPSQAPTQVMTDSELARLAALAMRIEEHFGDAQEIEWACDGDGKLWIVQARPLGSLAPAPGIGGPPGRALVRGLGAAPGRAIGRARVVGSFARRRHLAPGEILVAHVTGPEAAPLLHGVSAIVTDTGGMSSYAAVVARRMRIPCVVGTGEATTLVGDGQPITVDGDHGLVLGAPGGIPAA